MHDAIKHTGNDFKIRFFKLFCLLTSAFSLPSAALATEEDIMDIRGMRGLGFWEANWQWAVPSIIGVLIVLGLIIYFASKKKPEPPLTAYQLAQKELNEASMQIGTGDDKAFSFAVSDALRHYLEGAFRIRAPEQTTEEFLETAKSDKRIAEDALETLAEFLALCDLAKFARHAFGEEERTKLLSTAKEFVQKAHQSKIPYQQPKPSVPVNNILPRIKHKNFVKAVKSADANSKEMPITRPFINDLLIAYAFDEGPTFRFVNQYNLDEISLDKNELHIKALGNLKHTLKNIEHDEMGPVRMMKTGNDLEACLLLLDNYWEQLEMPTAGDIVVAVPARELLFVTTSDSTDGTQLLKEIIDKTFEPERDQTHNLTQDLLLRKDGRWILYK